MHKCGDYCITVIAKNEADLKWFLFERLKHLSTDGNLKFFRQLQLVNNLKQKQKQQKTFINSTQFSKNKK